MSLSISGDEMRLFNSTLETGVRTVIVLNELYPKSCDLTHLTWLDHLVVHTGDIGGPVSLHPDLPQRSGELIVRRQIIERGLTLMRRLHLIDFVAKEEGILYRATEEAYPFVGLMKARYALALQERARWVNENVCAMDDHAIKRLVAEKAGRWSVEFHDDGSSGGLS